MKKISVLLCICFFITGCSSSNSLSPKEVIVAFFDAYQKRDTLTLETYTNEEDFNVAELVLKEEDFIPDIDQELQKSVYTKMLAFSYTIDSVSTNASTAQVKVTLNMYDFHNAMQQGLKNISQKADELSQRSDNQKNEQQILLTLLFEQLNQAKQDLSLPIVVNLKKENGRWLLADDNSDLKNALVQNTQAISELTSK